MIKDKFQKLLNFLSSDKCNTDSDLYDFCESNRIKPREAFHIVSVMGAPECCRSCKHVDMRPSMPPCPSCSRGKPDLYENGNKYIVHKRESYKDFDRIGTTLAISGSPIKELRKIFPECNVYRGNSENWNIALIHPIYNTHLYYVVSI